MISKSIVNRLKNVLLDIISIEQSIFVSHKQNLDNVICTQEAIYTMNKNPKAKNIFIALKLYISKTYY